MQYTYICTYDKPKIIFLGICICTMVQVRTFVKLYVKSKKMFSISLSVV